MTTLTAWDSEESYQKYHSAQTPYSEVPTYPFARTESLEFIAQSSHGSAPM
jgi:hypothetical protein